MKEYMFKLGFKIQADGENDLDQKIAELLVSLDKEDNLVNFIINNAAIWESNYLGEIKEEPSNVISCIDFLRAFRGGRWKTTTK